MISSDATVYFHAQALLKPAAAHCQNASSSQPCFPTCTSIKHAGGQRAILLRTFQGLFWKRKSSPDHSRELIPEYCCPLTHTYFLMFLLTLELVKDCTECSITNRLHKATSCPIQDVIHFFHFSPLGSSPVIGDGLRWCSKTNTSSCSFYFSPLRFAFHGIGGRGNWLLCKLAQSLGGALES